MVYNPNTQTASWTSLDHNLGDQPVLDSVYDWRTGLTYISTDWGVYVSNLQTNDWDPVGINLPPSPAYGRTLAGRAGQRFAAARPVRGDARSRRLAPMLPSK